MARIRESYDEVGFGPWGVELLGQPGLIGVVGLGAIPARGPVRSLCEIGKLPSPLRYCGAMTNLSYR
jgi:RimJ/RimL family protein N-acetyltransferase